MIEDWDKEEEAKDAKTWESVESGENAINYILKKYMDKLYLKKIYG